VLRDFWIWFLNW